MKILLLAKQRTRGGLFLPLRRTFGGSSMTSGVLALNPTARTSGLILMCLFAAITSCSQRTTAPVYDILMVGGEIYDGTGAAPIKADIAISGDKIAKIGQVDRAQSKRVIDATGQAVAPGFINMLSWST